MGQLSWPTVPGTLFTDPVVVSYEKKYGFLPLTTTSDPALVPNPSPKKAAQVIDISLNLTPAWMKEKRKSISDRVAVDRIDQMCFGS